MGKALMIPVVVVCLTIFGCAFGMGVWLDGRLPTQGVSREHAVLLERYYEVAPYGLAQLKESFDQQLELQGRAIDSGIVKSADELKEPNNRMIKKIYEALEIRRQIHELGVLAPND